MISWPRAPASCYKQFCASETLPRRDSLAFARSAARASFIALSKGCNPGVNFAMLRDAVKKYIVGWTVRFMKFFAPLMQAVVVAGSCAMVMLPGRASAQSGAAGMQPAAPLTQPPQAPREFRGTWIPSVYNLCWPSKPGLPSQVQQQELITLLDEIKALNMNAVFLQVRPAGDALYDTKLAPWSAFLTGQQGKAPEPYYDPLQFATQEAHRRGLQLHAWINPYRVGARSAEKFASNSAVHTLAKSAKKLDTLVWLDPGEPQVRDHVIAIVADLVSRYDIDGVHVDDYFYPYKGDMKKLNGDFPDQETYQRYQAAGGKLGKDDWRRANVDELIMRMDQTIKQIKPRVYFSTAPFGIWRPGYPEGISGLDSYAELYGDSRKWLREGWQDFIAPQLYWDLSKEKQSFPKLLAWWNSENIKGRHVWPGISISGAGSSFPTDDVIKRIQIVRDQEKQNAGNLLWSFTPLHENKTDLGQKLKSGLYAAPSLVPVSPWLDNRAPAPPQVAATRDVDTGAVGVQWQTPTDPDALLVALYAQVGGQWMFTTVPAGARSYKFGNSGALPTAIYVSMVDRTGNESQKVPVALQGGNAGIHIPSPVSAPPLPGR